MSVAQTRRFVASFPARACACGAPLPQFPPNRLFCDECVARAAEARRERARLNAERVAAAKAPAALDNDEAPVCAGASATPNGRKPR